MFKQSISQKKKLSSSKYLEYATNIKPLNFTRKIVIERTVEQSESFSEIRQPAISISDIKSMVKTDKQIPKEIVKEAIIHEPNINLIESNMSSTKQKFIRQDRKSILSMSMLQIFNDDDQIQPSYNQSGRKPKIQVSLKAQRSQIKLGESILLPAMCSVLARGGIRTNIDLICVIDISLSMSGQKIKLVKDTMIFLIKALTPQDRLSIITFSKSGRRVCGLKALTQENINIKIQGDTNIMSGMQLALKTIRDRKIQNHATSIFLLSDGQDQNAEIQLKKAFQDDLNSQLGVFTIHSFGFGQDHDEDLMNKICKLKDGTFYYIQELYTLDEAFSNALGGIISSVATQAILKVKCVSCGIVQGIKIKKVYGDKWYKISQEEYVIKLTQLVSEVSKDFVFQLDIPALNGIVKDAGRQHLIIELDFQATSMSKDIIRDRQTLSLVLMNKNEEIVQINENVDVIQNYLRVQAAETIQESIKKAQKNNFKQAELEINKMIIQIRNSVKARPEKVFQLLKDLQLLKSKCRKDTYDKSRKLFKSCGISHIYQDNYQYSNPVQSMMVNLARSSRFLN